MLAIIFSILTLFSTNEDVPHFSDNLAIADSIKKAGKARAKSDTLGKYVNIRSNHPSRTVIKIG
jgi:hypothetical protein